MHIYPQNHTPQDINLSPKILRQSLIERFQFREADPTLGGGEGGASDGGRQGPAPCKEGVGTQATGTHAVSYYSLYLGLSLSF